MESKLVSSLDHRSESPNASSRGPVLALLLCASACTPKAGEPIPIPSVSPEGMSDRAFELYDTDHNGSLDKKELLVTPGLSSGMSSLDGDRDGTLTRAELVAGLQAIKDSNTGAIRYSCSVLLDGMPLTGAQVTLVPEQFLGPDFKPATGTTGVDGSVALKTEGMDIPGVQCGFFRVQVSKLDPGGKELIPTRFNSESTLGLAVFPTGRGESVLRLRTN